MNTEVQERRQRQRFDDILTQIEDVTYGVLRNRPSNGADSTEQGFALAVAAK